MLRFFHIYRGILASVGFQFHDLIGQDNGIDLSYSHLEFCKTCDPHNRIGFFPFDDLVHNTPSSHIENPVPQVFGEFADLGFLLRTDAMGKKKNAPIERNCFESGKAVPVYGRGETFVLLIWFVQLNIRFLILKVLQSHQIPFQLYTQKTNLSIE